MTKFGIEFRFPRDEKGLRALSDLVEHPDRARDPYLDEGEVTVLIDDQPVLPPRKSEQDRGFTGFTWVGGTLGELRTAIKRLQEGETTTSVAFLDSPIGIEFRREGTNVQIEVVAEVGPEMTRTPIGSTRVRLDELASASKAAMKRYDARLREIDPKLPDIYGFEDSP
jgi:hypothetical protein